MKNFYLAFLVGRPLRRTPSRSSGILQKRSAIAARFIVAGLLVVVFPGCAGGHQYHSIPGEGPPRTPRHLQLDRPISVATLHFPAGVYSLRSEDAAGYYYAAPRPIVQHTALGSVFRKGGIYVNKRDPRKLRGYIYWAGALTHIGDFSKKKYEFR